MWTNVQIRNFYHVFDNGTFCFGERLVHAKFPEDSQLARLVVSDSHQLPLHGGTSKTTAHIRTLSGLPGLEIWLEKRS